MDDGSLAGTDPAIGIRTTRARSVLAQPGEVEARRGRKLLLGMPDDSGPNQCSPPAVRSGVEATTAQANRVCAAPQRRASFPSLRASAFRPEVGMECTRRTALAARQTVWQLDDARTLTDCGKRGERWGLRRGGDAVIQPSRYCAGVVPSPVLEVPEEILAAAPADRCEHRLHLVALPQSRRRLIDACSLQVLSNRHPHARSKCARQVPPAAAAELGEAVRG